MVENSKQVRVDNWGIFFLQRLQMFFSKTDYCDLTLQFEGNVQLKVHRLVMSACTEYFQFLEHTCPQLEENVIMMPSDLQADVIVPIVNFMYTGMLEFHISIFEKLYKAADMMNITVLTKLLDAQKQPLQQSRTAKKLQPIPWMPQSKKAQVRQPQTALDLPQTLPGRKLPVWKRKNAPSNSPVQAASQLYSEPKWVNSPDPLSIADNAPKPTRFEWPDEELPALNLMDTSFDEISYTSKPLLTQEEEVRASTSFDDLRHNVPNSHGSSAKRQSNQSIDMEDMKDYVKEQKIRTDLTNFDEEHDGDVDQFVSKKRKVDAKGSPKKVMVVEKENREASISISTKSGNPGELNHTKIVSEILKRYPHLVKKNKNIRLKIMATGSKQGNEQQKQTVVTPRTTPSATKVQMTKANQAMEKAAVNSEVRKKPSQEGPWICEKCVEGGDEQQFALYYLYRKHMTDVHNEQFDTRLCKYCGQKCSKTNLMMYHLYTKHGLKPTSGYNFPKCDYCPFIAISAVALERHKRHHDKSEMQCVECKLAFSSKQTLTSHLQITGHTGKSGKNNYDCQYCTKRYQSAVNLFSHIKLQHKSEARRDGMVSIDEELAEDEDEEEVPQEEEAKEEYILPEIMVENESQKDKVKIISNVKVPMRQSVVQESTQHHNTVLEPSSEAEALSNVASGIATSLGLVDIVVLDENQQYILQQQQTQEGHQPEYILPELSSVQNPFSSQVITTQSGSVIPQTMLQTGGDIGSTDELVMVLTDHDYQDGQGDGQGDNSNIVVLYSHPVEEQQGQFITSQGNLMVNSQTCMLEIRNSGTMGTSSKQLVIEDSEDSHIESIEMIQREINSHNELKQEPSFYEEEKESVTASVPTEPQETAASSSEALQEELEHNEEEQETISQDNTEEPNTEPQEVDAAVPSESHDDGQLENLEMSQILPEQLDTDVLKKSMELIQESTDSEQQPPEEEISKECEEKDQIDSVEEHSNNVVQEEAMDVDETSICQTEENVEEEVIHTTELSKESNESLPPSAQSPQPPTSDLSVSNISEEAPATPKKDEQGDGDKTEEETETSEVLERITSPEHEPKMDEENKEYVPEPMEVDGSLKQQESVTDDVNEDTPGYEVQPESESEQNITDTSLENQVIKEPPALTEEEVSSKEPEASAEGDDNCREQEVEESTQSQQHEEISQSASESQQDECIQSETSNSQFNDENSQSSQESTQSTEKSEQTTKEARPHSDSNHSAKISILDDWDDTDSQQSEKQQRVEAKAGETVNNLMDDWDEEEEDESKKDHNE